jgi:phosphotransferase system HPr-like phosphotransfer protein
MNKKVMTVENMNGIDAPALKAFVDGVKNDPDQRMASFKVKTKWKGQTKTIMSNIGLHARAIRNIVATVRFTPMSQ